MAVGYIPDAVILTKLDKTRSEMFDYIEKNIETIKENIPVFFSRIALVLGKSRVSIPDSAYDAFIDAIMFKVLDVSDTGGQSDFIRQLTEEAVLMKREPDKMGGIHLATAIALIKRARYLEAAKYLEPYRTFDVQIGCWHAFCYFSLYRHGSGEKEFHPNDRWKYLKVARKLMGELSQWKPPTHRLLSGEISGISWLSEAFWLMMFNAMEWLPEERWYFEIGVKKAKEEKNEVILARILQISLVRFPGDLFFFREAYFRNFEEGELEVALSVVSDMELAHPYNLEPLYFGLRTSFFIQDSQFFWKYRTLAGEKQMPVHVLKMIDFGYAYMNGKENQAKICLADFQQNFPEYRYFSQILNYIAFQNSHGKKRVRSLVFRAVDQFCMRMLQVPLY